MFFPVSFRVFQVLGLNIKGVVPSLPPPAPPLPGRLDSESLDQSIDGSNWLNHKNAKIDSPFKFQNFLVT